MAVRCEPDPEARLVLVLLTRFYIIGGERSDERGTIGPQRAEGHLRFTWGRLGSSATPEKVFGRG
ncbi:hypothetical protein E2C01_049469 [Portunus trituberculatus]|uniref:Uncharacterized protein n=1 Tax=Portunus trituberculatus TaxID=210409 RepID=A0A5B7GD64_PORTR|nr:hypothetical protein [Portunus trituberculatus]